MSVTPSAAAPSPLLTIAIPTFNRAERLRVQLEALVAQLTPEVRICVFDNGSPDHTQEVAESYTARGVTYRRATYNAGGGRNFFRAMEECETEWLWILSDDDPAAPGTVAALLETLRRTNADYVHTSSLLCQYDAEHEAASVGELFQYGRFGAFLWLSCNVYRIASFRPFFRLYNDAISTMAPQMLVVLALLETGHALALLSPLRLFRDPEGGVDWSTLNFILRVSQAPDFLAKSESQRLLADGILLDWFDGAMLHGLRETGTPTQLRRWRRVYRLAKLGLRSFGARRHWMRQLRLCSQPGRRNETLKNIAKALIVGLLGACPPFLFHPLLKVLPLSAGMRRQYEQRDRYTVYE